MQTNIVKIMRAKASGGDPVRCVDLFSGLAEFSDGTIREVRVSYAWPKVVSGGVVPRNQYGQRRGGVRGE